jgi:hypothetical protein
MPSSGGIVRYRRLLRPGRQQTTDANSAVHTSVLLQRLHDSLPKGHFTLGWLMESLQKRSFGMIILLLAVVAIAPGSSIVAGLLLLIPVYQMMAGRSAASFPRFISARPLPTRHLAALMQRAVPVLRYLETIVHPRWAGPFVAIRPIVGIIIALLDAFVVLAPIPLTQVLPALVIALIALAYLEEDGLLLSLAMLVALVLVAAGSVAAWELVRGAKWMITL